MPVTVLTDLNKMTTEDIVWAASNLASTFSFKNDFQAEFEALRRLLDELERRLVTDRYIN